MSKPGNFAIEKRIESSAFYSLNFDTRYFLSTRTSLNFGVASVFSSTVHYNQISFGANWHQRTTGSKKQFFFEPGFNVNYFAIGTSFGETQILNSFQLNGKKFPEGKMRLYYGERGIGIGPSIQYRYKINPRLSFFANASTTFVVASKNVLFFKQHGVFRSLRSFRADQEIILLRDNVPEDDGPLSLSAFGVPFSGGLQLGVN